MGNVTGEQAGREQGKNVVRWRRGCGGVEQEETERQATLSVRGQICHGQSFKSPSGRDRVKKKNTNIILYCLYCYVIR